MNEIQVVLRELVDVLEQIPETEIHEFAKVIDRSRRIFITGEGRSGLMAKAFAMRLMHLEVNTFVVGETITPAMRADDILIAISGSGKTETVNLVAGKAKELGCDVIAVTANLESPLAKKATQAFRVPGATKYRLEGEQKSVQLLSSLFDQSLHIFLDAVCLNAANALGKIHSTVLSKHSNLE